MKRCGNIFLIYTRMIFATFHLDTISYILLYL